MLSAFEGLAHVGGIVYENDLDPLSKFFEMIKEIIDERQRLFQGGNYTQYVQTHDNQIPAIVIAIDQYANFKEKTNNGYEDILIRFSRDGISYGIYLVITAAGFGGAEIQSRIGDNIRTVLCLEMKDKYQYAEALKTLHFDIMPEADIKGRGLARIGGAILEFQTALSLRAKDDYARTEAIKNICSQMNQVWQGTVARAVPRIPEKPLLKEFLDLPAMQKQSADTKYLPMGYNLKNAAIYGVDLSKTYCYTITGRSRSGKTNLLKVLINTASLQGGNLTVIDFSGGLKQIAEQHEARYVDSSSQLFDFFKDLLPEFKERNSLKKELRLQGMEGEEIFEQMQQRKPYFIFIDDLSVFVDQVLHPADGVGDMKGFMENITEKGSLHHIYFFSCLSVEEIPKMVGIRLYENMLRFKTGIHLGGNVSAVQRIFQFAYISYAEQGQTMKPGTGLLPTDGETDVQRVLIPLVRR